MSWGTVVFHLRIVLVIFTISGCTTSVDVAVTEQDRYALAAKSWEGASLPEMIAAWGPPNRAEQPPKGETDGFVWWEYYSPQRRSDQHGITYRYYCSAVAHFNSTLTITSIEIKHSRNCYRLYEGQFESMTRHREMTDLTTI